jgi:DNA-binding PadR family transcriptional regulator
MADPQRDITEHVPLTDLSFHIILALGDGASFGYAIGKEVERRSDGRLNPTTGSLYQSLRRLHEDGLIAECERPKDSIDSDNRRQYFRLTPFGRRVFAHEARRLEKLISAARDKNLMPKRP